MFASSGSRYSRHVAIFPIRFTNLSFEQTARKNFAPKKLKTSSLVSLCPFQTRIIQENSKLVSNLSYPYLSLSILITCVYSCRNWIGHLLGGLYQISQHLMCLYCLHEYTFVCEQYFYMHFMLVGKRIDYNSISRHCKFKRRVKGMEISITLQSRTHTNEWIHFNTNNN